MTPVALTSSEAILFSWRISARTYAIRVGVILGIWAVLGQMASFGQSAFVQLTALPGSVVVGLFYMWVFGELDLWPINRRTEWHLTNQAIHIIAEDDLPSRIALNDIRRIHRWPFWSLVVRFNNGTALTLPVPPNPSALRQRILAARDGRAV